MENNLTKSKRRGRREKDGEEEGSGDRAREGEEAKCTKDGKMER